jgi:hypothetical protein
MSVHEYLCFSEEFFRFCKTCESFVFNLFVEGVEILIGIDFPLSDDGFMYNFDEASFN